MATFINLNEEKNTPGERGTFDVDSALRKNAWHPTFGPCEAEKILSGKPVFTYLLRRSCIQRGFSISFVQRNGMIKHDEFTLIDPKYGIWRNGHNSHVGRLEKVICDMMDCTPIELLPL